MQETQLEYPEMPQDRTPSTALYGSWLKESLVAEIHPQLQISGCTLWHSSGALVTPALEAQLPYTGAQDNLYKLSAAHTICLYN